MLTLLQTRILLAFSIWPDMRGWLSCVVIFAVAALLLMWQGRRSGFLHRSLPPLSRRVTLRILLVTWLLPALVEELCFRVLLVPHPSESLALPARLLWTTLALAAFVIAHPLRRWLRPLPRNRVFTDHRFLQLATTLGAACTLAYLATGSLWPPALIHYVFLTVWLIGWNGWHQITA